MIKVETSAIIQQSVRDSFNYIATNFFENQSTWDAAVVELKKTSPEAMGVGTVGWQVLDGDGWRTETFIEVTDYDLNQTFSTTSTGKPYFKSSYTFEPVADGTKLTHTLEIGVEGAARLVQPLISKSVKKTIQTNMDSLKALLELQVCETR